MLKRLAACFVLFAMFGCDQADDTAAPEPEVAPVATEPVQTKRVPAEVGVGQRGRSLDNETGIGRVIAQPAKSLFAFEEKAIFDFKIVPAMNLYKASSGKNPSSDEEFMTKIIRANNIRLPELPEGHKYVYEPSTGKLMVERPN